MNNYKFENNKIVILRASDRKGMILNRMKMNGMNYYSVKMEDNNDTIWVAEFDIKSEGEKNLFNLDGYVTSEDFDGESIADKLFATLDKLKEDRIPLGFPLYEEKEKEEEEPMIGLSGLEVMMVLNDLIQEAETLSLDIEFGAISETSKKVLTYELESIREEIDFLSNKLASVEL